MSIPNHLGDCSRILEMAIGYMELIWEALRLERPYLLA
jgi:hypothetical protein